MSITDVIEIENPHGLLGTHVTDMTNIYAPLVKVLARQHTVKQAMLGRESTIDILFELERRMLHDETKAYSERIQDMNTYLPIKTYVMMDRNVIVVTYKLKSMLRGGRQ